MTIIQRAKQYMYDHWAEIKKFKLDVELIDIFNALLVALDGKISDYHLSLVAKLFKNLDEVYFRSEERKLRYYSKGFYERTIVFKNGIVRYKRRAYVLKEEYKSPKQNQVFMLDVKLGIHKNQRIDLNLSLEIIKKMGANFSYQDIVDMFPNANISKQTVHNTIKRLKLDDVLTTALEEPRTKLKHNGVIYIETDEAFKNAISYQKRQRDVMLKRLRLTVIHTGFVDQKAKRKKMNNVRMHITMANEDEKSIKSKKYWKGIYSFLEANYHDVKNAKIMILGDGGKYIPASEIFFDCMFVIDRFHVAKKIKDCILGTRMYKKVMSIRLVFAILRLDWAQFDKYLAIAIRNTVKEHQLDKIVELIKYINTYRIYIERWSDKDFIGCRIESYIGRIVKVMFRSKPKIFNEKTVYKAMLIKELLMNGVEFFKLIEKTNDKIVENKILDWRWKPVTKKSSRVTSDCLEDSYHLPILKNSSKTNTRKMIENLVYNYL